MPNIKFQITTYPNNKVLSETCRSENIARTTGLRARLASRVSRVSSRELPEKFTSHNKVTDSEQYRAVKATIKTQKSTQDDRATKGFVRLSATFDHITQEHPSSSALCHQPLKTRRTPVSDNELRSSLRNALETIMENSVNHQLQGWGYTVKSCGGESQKTTVYNRPQSPDAGTVERSKQYKFHTETLKCTCSDCSDCSDRPETRPKLRSYSVNVYVPKSKKQPVLVKFSNRYDDIDATGAKNRFCEKNVFFDMSRKKFTAILPKEVTKKKGQ